MMIGGCKDDRGIGMLMVIVTGNTGWRMRNWHRGQDHKMIRMIGKNYDGKIGDERE